MDYSKRTFVPRHTCGDTELSSIKIGPFNLV